LIVVACLVTVFSFVIMINDGISCYRLFVEMAIFGGLIFAVYPLSVARANDVLGGTDAVRVSSALLLCYSIGAIFGPILASILMTLLKSPYGLFTYWSLVSCVFAVITIILKHKERITIIKPADQVNFVPMKNTSFVAMALDPRIHAEKD
jgi:MFS family permease